MNKFYFLFAGKTDNPEGGWRDFVSSFTFPHEAMLYVAREKYNWWQVIDVRTREIIYEHYS